MLSDEEALALVRTKAEGLRRRRAAKVASGSAVALAFVVFVALSIRPSEHSTLELSGGEGSTTTVDASTTTEGSATSEGPATSEPGAPAAGAPSPTEPLTVHAVLLDDHPIVDSDVHFRLTITDGDGSLTGLTADHSRIRVELGTFPECGQRGPSSVTMDVAVPMKLWELNATYNDRRRGGGWLDADGPLHESIVFTTTSRSGCDREETVSNRIDITLGYGNGPEAPRRVFPENPDDYQFVPLISGDCDGVLDRIEVDWGDGSGVESVPFRIYGCNEGGKWYHLNHEYAAPGTYTITATAVSVDDQGQREQRSLATTYDVTVRPSDDGGPVTVP